MTRIRLSNAQPILPYKQSAGEERTPLIRQTSIPIRPQEGETSNAAQETRPTLIKPKYTAKEIIKMFDDDFSKHTRGHIAVDALWATGNQIASVAKHLGTAAFTAVTLPWLLEKFIPKNSDAFFYSALFLNPYFMNGAMAGANEMGRQLGKTTDTLMQKALMKQITKSMYKENNKMIKGISSYVFGGWRPKLPRRAEMMAQAMRGRNNGSDVKYDKSQAGLAIVDKAIDNDLAILNTLKDKDPKIVNTFDNFLHHLKAWELMAKVPLSHKVLNLFHEEENGDPNAQVKLNPALEKIEAMAPEAIRDELSSFMKAWCLSTLPGIPPEQGFIALVGDTKLPNGKDLAKAMCKELTGKKPVSVSADQLNEFIDVVVSKDAVPRVKQKTANPKVALGPFKKWIKSGNSACPIVITEFDFANSKHLRLIENLRKSTKIDIYYDEIKGAKFTVNTQRTRFILCAREPGNGSEMSHMIPHAVIGQPSKDDRHKVLDLTLEKQRKEVLDNFPLTEEQKDDIEELIRQDRNANLIIEKSMKHKLSYRSMREVIKNILIEVALGYQGIGALKGMAGTQQEGSTSAEGEAGPGKFIKNRFKAFPKQTEGKDKKDSKDKKDAKGKNVAETPPQEKYVQASTIEFDSSSLSRPYDIFCSEGRD